MRRWYARRLVKYIDKSKEKRRGLSGDLAKVDGMTRAMPKAERLKTIEKMLEPVEEERLSRELRRAAARQGRASGHGTASKRRPGMPPTRVVYQRGKRPR